MRAFTVSAVALIASGASAQAPDRMAWNWVKLNKHMAQILADGFQVVGFHWQPTSDGFVRYFYLQQGAALVQCTQAVQVATKTQSHGCEQLASPK